MCTSFERAHLRLLESISEFVANQHFALAFGYEIEVVIVRSDRLILLAEYILRCVQHSFHSFDDIVNDILIVSLRDVKLVYIKQMLCNRIRLNSRLENLYRTKNAISLRYSPLHEFVEFVLKCRC